MTTMRERLARAFIAELDRQGCYNHAPGPNEPLASPQGADFADFVIDGKLDGRTVIDAILAELREPDEGMVRAGAVAGERAVAAADPLAAHDCNVHESQPPAIFTAMIDHVRKL